jgi:hypothetical protein
MAPPGGGGSALSFNDNRVAHKPLSVCGQVDFAWLRSRLDNHLRQSVKNRLVGEIWGSPLRSNGGRKHGLRDSVAALLPGSRACESVTGLTGETA